MKKYFIIVILLTILVSCSNNSQKQNIDKNLTEKTDIKQDINSNISNKDQKNDYNIIKKLNITQKNNIFEAKTNGGTTDFLAFNINTSNFEENNSKVDGVIEKSYLKKDKLQIILEASNHVYSYEDANYLNDITLSNINPTDYKIISTKMGGHHVIVILDFPLGTKIDELKFNNSPVGDISLVFNK